MNRTPSTVLCRTSRGQRSARFAAGVQSSTIVVLAATISITLACSAAAPAMQQFSLRTATQDAGQQWSVAHIAKPGETPTALRATPIETATALVAEVTPTNTPETLVPEIPPAVTEDPALTEAGESPLITMVIVGEDPQQPPAIPEANPPAPASGKYIVVSLSEQHLYAYENGQVVYSFVASTGMGNSTRVGTFQVLDKIPNAYGANWNIWMPNWMGIYWSGSLENGIHALPILPGGGRLWAGYLGTPISYGCVVLGVEESLQLYDWAEVGTPVEIRW